MATSKARRGQLRGQRVRALFKMKHAQMKKRSRGLRVRVKLKIKTKRSRYDPHNPHPEYPHIELETCRELAMERAIANQVKQEQAFARLQAARLNAGLLVG